MKGLPLPALDAPPEISALTKPQLAAMREGLVEAMVSTARQFYQFIYHPEHANPRTRAMFETLVARDKPELHAISFCLGQLTPKQLDKQLAAASKRMTHDLQLFATQGDEYKLRLPIKRDIQFPDGYPAAYADLPVYNAMGTLFRWTQVLNAEIRPIGGRKSGKLFQTDPEGIYCEYEEYFFEEEAKLLGFVNRLMPIGKRFSRDEGMQRAN